MVTATYKHASIGATQALLHPFRSNGRATAARDRHRSIVPTDSLEALFAPIARRAVEMVVFVFLDRGGGMLGLRHIPSACFTSVDVPLRTVVADALAFDARIVAMAHNHPSGDPEPSAEDLRVTRMIATTLSALGVRLIDHFVLTGDAVTSFRARGLL